MKRNLNLDYALKSKMEFLELVQLREQCQETQKLLADYLNKNNLRKEFSSNQTKCFKIFLITNDLRFILKDLAISVKQRKQGYVSVFLTNLLFSQEILQKHEKWQKVSAIQSRN